MNTLLVRPADEAVFAAIVADFFRFQLDPGYSTSAQADPGNIALAQLDPGGITMAQADPGEIALAQLDPGYQIDPTFAVTAQISPSE
jgi:hypothetical protein